MVVISDKERAVSFIKIQVAFILMLLLVGISNSNAEIDCSPCMCSASSVLPVMLCDVKTDNDLIEANKRAGAITYNMYGVVSAHLNRIDENTFRRVNFKHFFITTAVVNEFHLFSAFRGKKETLTKLQFDNATVHRWVYSTGEEFQRLHHFTLLNCSRSTPRWKELYNILNTFPGDIRYVVIENCQLESRDMFGIHRFTNLTQIKLAHNKLKSVNRCYFPWPAPRLVSFELSFNPIKFLPDDMFQDMPALKYLRLDGLKLTTLHEHIFKPIFKQLNRFSINDVPLACDCNAAWLLARKYSLGTRAFLCKRPSSFSPSLSLSYSLSYLGIICSKVSDSGGITKNIRKIAVSCSWY